MNLCEGVIEKRWTHSNHTKYLIGNCSVSLKDIHFLSPICLRNLRLYHLPFSLHCITHSVRGFLGLPSKFHGIYRIHMTRIYSLYNSSSKYRCISELFRWTFDNSTSGRAHFTETVNIFKMRKTHFTMYLNVSHGSSNISNMHTVDSIHDDWQTVMWWLFICNMHK